MATLSRKLPIQIIRSASVCVKKVGRLSHLRTFRMESKMEKPWVISQLLKMGCSN